MPDYLTLVKDKNEERSALVERMKSDVDLLYLNEYVMKGIDAHKIPDIVNVTLNRPAVFFHNVVSALGKTSEQAVVETEDKGIDPHYIEDFQSASFRSANARLTRQGRYELNPWFDFHSCIRGSTAALCIFQMVDGVLDTNITPWDMRYVTYEMGVDGMQWAAYETKKTKDMIEVEYGGKKMGGKEIKLPTLAKAADVLDVWHTKGSEVWIAGKKIGEQEHQFGFCPVVIQKAVLGSMLADSDALAHEGEGLFFLIRGVIPELNRLLSIMQTLTFKSVKPPMKAKKKGGGEVDYEKTTASGAMTTMETDEDIQRLDYGDATRAAQHAYSMMNKAMEEGSLTSFDLGTFTQTMSAIALLQIGEGRDQVFLPRLDVKSLMNEHLSEMFTEQVIQIGGSVEIGTKGHKRTFETSKLEGEYETTYEYFVKSPTIDAGRISLGAAYGNAVSQKYKDEKVYQFEDPAGEDRQRRWEESERIFPGIKMRRDILALDELEEDAEVQIALAQLGITLDQLKAGEVEPPKPEPEDEPTQVLSMFGGAQGGPAKPQKREGEL